MEIWKSMYQCLPSLIGLTELWDHFQFVANLGPQTKFPVPQGLLDYNGKK